MPLIFVEVTRSFTDCVARPGSAPHADDLSWLDDVIAAMEILQDLSGVEAGAEALNPFFIEMTEEEAAEETRRPTELWALLSKIEHWKDRFDDGESIMVEGREWIGAVPFEDRRLEVLIFAAQPSMDSHVIGLLLAVPLGEGEAAVAEYAGRADADETYAAILAAVPLT